MVLSSDSIYKLLKLVHICNNRVLQYGQESENVASDDECIVHYTDFP